MKLTIELVPQTCWYANVRSEVTPAKWNQIRKATYALYDNKCGICGAKKRLEAHEIWEYDDKHLTQTLNGMIALCSNCHKIKHYGFSEILASQGKINLANLIVHFCKVNNCDIEAFLKHKNESWKVWLERSNYQWTLDISYLLQFEKTQS